MADASEPQPEHRGPRGAVRRLIAIADRPDDDDDARLRKRVGVGAGYVTIVAPLGVPLATPTPLLGWVVALALSSWSVANLVVLARTKRFDRYVVALIAVGPPFVLLATVLAGGVTHTPGLVWAFLTPAYALLALGPQRATRWLFVFLVTLIVAAAMDPFVGGLIAPPPYATQLVFYVQGVGVPLTITFLLLRYVDIRRRAAEARSDAADQRDPGLDRDPSQARRRSDRRGVSGDHGRLRRYRQLHAVGPADRAGARRGPARRPVQPVRHDRRRSQHREDQDRRRRLHGRGRRAASA